MKHSSVLGTPGRLIALDSGPDLQGFAHFSYTLPPPPSEGPLAAPGQAAI